MIINDCGDVDSNNRNNCDFRWWFWQITIKMNVNNSGGWNVNGGNSNGENGSELLIMIIIEGDISGGGDNINDKRSYIIVGEFDDNDWYQVVVKVL